MPRSGGVYTLPPGYLAVSGETIQPSNHNPPLQDIAQALTESLPRDGTAGMTGNLPMGAHKITGLAAATNAGDVPRLDQVVRRDGNGAMTGNLAMGNNKITGLAEPTASGDAARKADVDAASLLSGGTIAGILNISSGAVDKLRLYNTVFSGSLFAALRVMDDGSIQVLSAQSGSTPYYLNSSSTAPASAWDVLTRGMGDGRYAPLSRSINTGLALLGGGDLSANRNLSLDMGQLPFTAASFGNPFAIVIDGNTQNTQSRMGPAALRNNFNLAGSATTITAGAGLTGGGTLAADRTIAMGTPSSITRTSTNSASGNTHTHNLPQADFRDMMANYLAFNALGTLVFAAKKSGGNVAPGGTAAGSTLAPASDGADLGTGSLTGTFLCLGDGTVNRGTLWLKVAG